MKIIESAEAPAAIGPYAQAVQVFDTTWFSGQIALDPSSGSLVPGDAAAQTRQVMANLRAVIEAAGLAMKDIVKTTIYLLDMADFEQVNAVYSEALEGHRPARATIAVAGLPRGARVEIDAIAVRPS